MNTKLEITASDIRTARAAYPKGAYHNFGHALDVLAEVWALASEAAVAVDLALVNQAALWHDVVYVSGAFDNEELSARFAYRVLHERDPEGAADVADLIRLTKRHAGWHNVEGALLCDADLAGFTKPFDEFEADNERVRREFEDAGFGPQFAAGRARFLQGLEARALAGTLLVFPVRLAERNARAADNIGRALREMEMEP